MSICKEVIYKDDYVYVTFDEPLKNVCGITDYTEKVEGECVDLSFKREIRWSYDGSEFSAWREYADVDFNTIRGDLVYLEVRYIRQGYNINDTLEFYSVSFNYKECESGDTKSTPKCNASVCSPQPIVQDKKSEYNPYDVGNTLNVQNQLTKLVNDLNGHCVKYYKIDPDLNSKDDVLHEYSLYKVDKVEELKIIVDNSTLPNNEPAYDFDGINMPSKPLQFQIARSEFEKVFGQDARPQQEDYFYFPLLNMWYDVHGAYFNESYMGHGTWYECYAFKKMEKTSHDISEEDDEFFQESTTSMEKQVGEQKNDDMKQVANEDQLTVRSTGKDIISIDLDAKLDVLSNELYCNYTVVSKNQYSFSKVSKNTSGVLYDLGVNLPNTENYSFITWFKLKDTLTTTEYNIVKVERKDIETSLALFTTSNPHGLSTNDFIRVADTGVYDGYHQIDVVSDTTFTIGKPYTKSLGGAVAKLKVEQMQPLLNGYDVANKSGIAFAVTNSAFIVLINGMFYSFDVKISTNTWYSHILNLGNTFNQLSLYLYEFSERFTIPSDPKSAEGLKLAFEDTISVASQYINAERNFSFDGGNYETTNIKIFDKLVEPEVQQNMLTSYLETDAQHALLVDMAKEPLALSRVQVK